MGCHLQIGHKDRQLVKLDMPVFMRAKSAANTVVGTFEYMAPEYMALSDPFSTYSASAADMWSCGVILAAMLAGRMPFPAAQDTKSQLALMLQAPAAVKLPHGTSAECVQLVSRLLQPDPNKRFTAAEVMQDPWFMQDLPPRALEMNQRFLAAHSVKAPSTLSREEPARLPAPSVDEMSEDMAADPEDAGNPLAQTTLQQVSSPWVQAIGTLSDCLGPLFSEVATFHAAKFGKRFKSLGGGHSNCADVACPACFAFAFYACSCRKTSSSS